MQDSTGPNERREMLLRSGLRRGWRWRHSRASIPGSQRTHLHGTVAFRTLAQLTEHGHRFPPRCLPGRRQWWRHPAGRFITIIIASTVDEEEEDSLFTSSLLFTSFTCHQPYIHGTWFERDEQLRDRYNSDILLLSPFLTLIKSIQLFINISYDCFIWYQPK